jgi:hypothetical protein
MQLNYTNKMAGISKIKYNFLFILCVLGFSSCKKDVESKQKFLEDNFLTIVDTAAYRYGSFRPMPPSPFEVKKEFKQFSKLSIELIDSITYDPQIHSEILLFFDNHKELKSEFKNLLDIQNKNKTKLNEFPEKIGKYIISINKKKVSDNNQYAGKIEIQNFELDKKKAFLIVIKSVKHSRIGILKLFIKENKRWKMIKQETLFES